MSSPYAYSSGTSDSTVFVTGALALIIQQCRDSIEGSDGYIDENEMILVKHALARSSDRSNFESGNHNSHSGYGTLDLVKWSEEVAFIFNVE